MTIEVDKNYFDKLKKENERLSAENKRNMPEKPKGGILCGRCECGKYVFSDENYCPECGQALEWENKKA